MATKKKMLQAAAGQAGGAALDITDVFSTYLYEGNGTSQTITNGIDLDGEGGLVWVKSRGSTANHVLVDTERGVRRNLSSNTTDAEGSVSGDNVNAFYSNGFLAGPDGKVNSPSVDYASWTFRKAPKFFDVVTWTGDGSASRNISHNLGATVGTIIVKRYNTTEDWVVFHRSLGANNQLKLNKTDAAGSLSGLFISAPTDSVFTVGSNSAINANGSTYVAYLFAHNDGDGEFGPDGSDIIKCGSYTGNGTSGVSVDLGFEPQWLLIKRATGGTSDWSMFDSMRGLTSNGLDARLAAQQASAEYDQGEYFSPTATGFYTDVANDNINQPGDTYIYMAIRRGPLAQPESATEVFAIDTRGATNPSFDSTSSVVDFSLMRANVTSSGDWLTTSRLTSPKYLETNSTNAEAVSSVSYDWMNGVSYLTGTNANFYSWMWKRAPGFFDVVAYTGGSPNNKQIPHNLGVVPELIIQKQRSGVSNWHVWCGLAGQDYSGRLNLANPFDDQTGPYYFGSHTDTYFSVGYTGYETNVSGSSNIAYLFATVPGVSKVGSYTGNGSSQTIDCGFTSGARFVLIKRTDSVGSWFVWDSERGIVSGNEPYLTLNQTAAEDSGSDTVDPNSSGFIVNETNYLNQNTSGGSYIFYAIA